MEKITVYTIGCPKCNQLEKKLQNCGFSFDRVTDENTLRMMNLTTFPYMRVGEDIMDFATAWKWINTHKEG